MRRALTLLLVLIAAAAASAGCAGEPELAGARAALDVVPRKSWESAPAGCEDAERAWTAGELRLAAVEGETALGALVGEHSGAPVCIDAMRVLVWERDRRDPTPTPLVRWDTAPTPTPLIPGE